MMLNEINKNIKLNNMIYFWTKIILNELNINNKNKLQKKLKV